jgi:hypothetical protein
MPILAKVLKTDMKKFPRKISDYSRLQVRSLEIQPAPGINVLSFVGMVRSETTPSNAYKTQIRFFDVEWSKTRTTRMDQPVPVGDNQTIWYHRIPNTRYNPIAIKCQCDDFRFRWEKQNHDAGSMIGNWRRYTRKTPPPPVGLPYVNPDDLLGYCKHIHNLFMALRDSGRIAG